MQPLIILVDGIVSAFARRLTPDVTWNLYRRWLERRRPELKLCHLQQHYDWLDIFSGRAEPYQELQEQMLRRLCGEVEGGDELPDAVVFLGFSLGGLTALALASRFDELTGGALPARLAFITFGAPYAGTGLLDRLFAKTHISYIERVVNLEETKRQARRLAGFAGDCCLTVLAHSIVRDEMVSPASARMLTDWLYFSRQRPELQYGAFRFDPQTLFQPHNTLMQNPLAFAYIDGLLDGLLPPPPGAPGYHPPGADTIRELRAAARRLQAEAS